MLSNDHSTISDYRGRTTSKHASNHSMGLASQKGGSMSTVIIRTTTVTKTIRRVRADLGKCDKCNDTYDLGSRDNRCGDCGNCGNCCTHDKWEQLEFDFVVS